MKDKDYVYLIYRVYSEKERPYVSLSDRTVFYGWAPTKSIVKAFMTQRTRSKYKVTIATYDEISHTWLASSMYDGAMDPELMIDYVNLKSAETNEDVKLFMTSKELREAEHNIQHYFKDLCSLADYSDNAMKLLELYINLDDYYLDALQYLGFKPPEMDILFDSAEYRESTDAIYSIDALIDSAYDALFDVPHEVYVHEGKIPGLSVLESVDTKILYSLESFMKVMKEDM